MKSVDGFITTPPPIRDDYLILMYSDGLPWNTNQTVLMWNESIMAGTEHAESGIYFPERENIGYMLSRFTDDHLIDSDIWTLHGYGKPETLFDTRNYVGCIIAASGIVSHPDYPYVGDTSWFNYDPVADNAPPSISKPTMSPQIVLFRGKVTFSAKTTDTQSGVNSGEFYIDKDPGQGNGSPMKFKNSKIKGSVTIKKLKPGVHTLYMRSVDAAGNWSKPVSKKFIYIGFYR